MLLSRRSFEILTGRLAINGKYLALCVRCVGSIRALEIHLLRGELGLRRNNVLRGPELLPWLRLLFALDNVGIWTMHFVIGFLQMKLSETGLKFCDWRS